MSNEVIVFAYLFWGGLCAAPFALAVIGTATYKHRS